MDVPPSIPAGEAFVASFAGMTRSMVAQSRALARKVSLAQLLDDTSSTNDHNNTNTNNKENRHINGINTTNGSVSSLRQDGAGAVVVGNTNNNNSSSNRETVLDNLRSLDAIVADLERRSAAVRDAIDREQRGNEAIQEMTETTKRRTIELAATCDALPQHLPHAAPPLPSASSASAAAAPNAVPSGVGTIAESGVAVSGTAATRTGRRGLPPTAAFDEGGNASRVATSGLPVVSVLELVTVGELEAVPRSTRARLTIAQVNGAVIDIQKAMERRYGITLEIVARIAVFYK